MAELPYGRKALGQHWLTDTASLQAICEAAEVSKADTVLEVGPGTGTLTVFLAKRAGRVIAVELDEQLADELPRRVPADNLEVVQQSILKFDLTRLTSGYKVVANIPYYLTGELLRQLSEMANPPARAVLLVQQEVAERVAARPGKMSLLSVTTQFYWEVSLGRVVPAKLFTPPPKVNSQIIVLARRPTPLYPGVAAKPFFRLVRICFAQRRKTLLNSLCAGLQLERPVAADLLKRSGISPGLRPQALSLEQWYSLYKST